MPRALALGVLALAACAGLPGPPAPEEKGEPGLALRKLRLPSGFRAEIFAAEPQLANPVAFSVDEKGRVFVSETHRAWTSVYDIRNYMTWLDDDLACRTLEDREAMCRKHLGKDAGKLAAGSEIVRLLEDRDGDRRAEVSTVFAEGFSTIFDGIASGVLARGGNVWFANIPNLWLLRDEDGDGQADVRKALHTGYGVRFNYIGHDLHGLTLGPDGKLYFSIGDRGLHVKTEGRTVSYPDAGAVLRSNPDGSELELYATGLRNPQELAFDAHGNLWTWDNNSDWHDMARWVYVVEGGDSGWRVGYQYMPGRGAWEDEKVWRKDASVPYRLPPIANLDHGPSGIAFYPGTGLPARYDNHFFACNFPGGINAWTVRPKGASFEVAGAHRFLWNVWATDLEFGPGPGLYVSDWGEGWHMKSVGRIFRVFDPALENDPAVLEVKRLLGEGMAKRPEAELSGLLSHRDLRVRQEAQFELARRGKGDLFLQVALQGKPLLARLHAIWGAGQLSRRQGGLVDELREKLARDPEPEIRAQVAKVAGEAGAKPEALAFLLRDESPRVRFFAAMALKRSKGALAPVLDMIRENADRDAYLRHAGVMALAGRGDVPALVGAGKDPSRSVRLAALLAMRRLERSEVRAFLADADPEIVLEAARAINDVPIPEAMPDLAALLGRPGIPERALFRSVNANFRLGTPEAAGRLAAFAARKDAPEGLRLEAVRALGEWAAPSGRDRVVGLWRPIAPRGAAPAREALEKLAADLQRGAPEEVWIETVRASVAVRANGANLLTLAADPRGAPRLRAAALQALGEFAGLEGAGAVALRALEDPNPTVREAAIRVVPRVAPQEGLGRLDRIAAGNAPLRLRQAAVAAMAATPGKEAETLLSGWVDRIPELPAGLRLDLVEAAQKRGVVADPDLHLSAEALLEGGDAAEGMAAFKRPDSGCVKCHKVNDGGGTVGPNLTLVGSRLSKEKILESLLAPNAEIAAGYEQVIVRTRSGDVKSGRVERETEDELVLMDAEGRLEKIAPKEIDARARGQSAMPEDSAKLLSKRDLRNLVAFLAACRGADPAALPLEPGAVVVDNEDPERFSTVGNWRTQTLGGDYGRHTSWAFPDPEGNARAAWTAKLPRRGAYRVYVWYGADPIEAHATNAPFTIEHAAGKSTVRVDQSRDTCAWKLLGRFTFAGEARVTLSTDADRFVYADAVKFAPE